MSTVFFFVLVIIRHIYIFIFCVTMASTTSNDAGTEKCPCCDNPWSRATGDFFAKLCVECDDDDGKDKDAAKAAQFGLSRDNMDLTVKPSENFFEYANGSWMKNNPIPAGYPSWNTFLALHVQSQERCKALLEGLTASESGTEGKKELTAEEVKVAAFYASALDEDAVEQAGIKPMKPLLDAIDQIVTSYEKKDLTEYATELGKLASNYGTLHWALFWLSLFVLILLFSPLTVTLRFIFTQVFMHS